MEEYEELNDDTGLVYRAWDVGQYVDYRERRFRQRFYTGFDVHAGEVARWFVLTESDEAIVMGLNLTKKFNELVRYLRRNYGKFEYCWVRHRQGNRKRINMHVVYFGEYIPQQVIEGWWWKNYASHRSKMGRVYNVKRQAWYLSKYLSGEDFERYFFSSEWVFFGWIGFSQWIKKEFGQYPPKEMLVELAKMCKAEREGHEWFGLFVDVRKCGWEGVYKAQNEKWKAILRQGDKKRKFESKANLNNSDNGQQLEFMAEKAGLSNDRSE